MKKNLINEINRISELMGGKPLLFEQAIPKILKPLLNLGDDVIKSFMKNFDSEVDDAVRVIKNADATTARNVVDDAVEVLVRNIDFPKLVNIMLDQKMLGTAWDSQIDRIITFLKANPEKEAEILAKLDDIIDGLPMLSDAPPELVTQITSQTKRKIKNELPKSSAGASAADNLADELDDLIGQTDQIMDDLDDVVKGMPANTPGREKIQTAWKKIFYNKESVYDEIRRRSSYINPKEYDRAGNIRNMTDDEIEKLLSVSGDPMRKPKDDELIKAVSAAQNANYFTAANSMFAQLPKAIQSAFWLVILSGGSALALGSSIMKILIGLMDIGSEKLDTIKITTGLVSLDKKNIISHLSSELNMPEDMLQDWAIDIKDDKLSAIVENPASDGKIYKVTLVINEDDPEKNYIKSQEL